AQLDLAVEAQVEDDDVEVAVDLLDLGALVALEDVLSDERMQPELLRDALHALGGGVDEVDPGTRVGVGEGLVGFGWVIDLEDLAAGAHEDPDAVLERGLVLRGRGWGRSARPGRRIPPVRDVHPRSSRCPPSRPPRWAAYGDPGRGRARG